MYILVLLKFTPLEFETEPIPAFYDGYYLLKFTPLEFETSVRYRKLIRFFVKIYSVGV